MELKFVTQTLVYVYEGGRDQAVEPETQNGDEWRVTTAPDIDTAFADDPKRHSRFHKYLKAGHMGLLLIRDGRWVAYGWRRNPYGSEPPHLPHRITTLGAYWIFGCHTREAYRRRGIYKQLLARLVAGTREDQILLQVYIDTHAENIASRRAILASGFTPRGVFSTYRIWAPFMGARIAGGRWRSEKPHPGLEHEIADFPAPAVAG